jgi:predicted dehydrogenase
MAFYVLEYADGLRAIGLDNCFTWVDHNIVWRVEGTEGVAKGTIGWPDYPAGSPSTIDWTTRAMDGAWERPRWDERWFPQAFKGTMGQLMRAIQEDAEPAISGRTTLGTMALVEACYRSLHEGRAVPIAEVKEEAGVAA